MSWMMMTLTHMKTQISTTCFLGKNMTKSLLTVRQATRNYIRNYMNNEYGMMKSWIVSLVLVLGSLAAVAGDDVFTVATLNVDGLPSYIGGIHINPDGPGGETWRVGGYLARKGYDIIGVQEDFNYDEELRTPLEETHYCGDWQGKINLGLGKILDVLVLGGRFETDGLRMFWRKQHVMESEEAVVWFDSYGKFDHCWDAIVVKGFRRCELTLSGGRRIVVYDMHMDASTDLDETLGNDGGDIDARRSQWKQLREEVLAHLDERPVILLGDMNSLYPRDSIQALFIDPINATGHHRVSDTWVEYELGGRYPAVGSGDRHVAYANGEVLDKILYINPVVGSRLKLESYRLETDYTYDDGTSMGDHYPVSATFSFVDEPSSGISSIQPVTASEFYSVEGRRRFCLQRGLNIVRTADGRVRKVVKK